MSLQSPRRTYDHSRAAVADNHRRGRSAKPSHPRRDLRSAGHQHIIELPSRACKVKHVTGRTYCGVGDGGSAMALPPLVGRDREFGLIEAFISNAAKRGGTLLFSGEAGVGKSVLLDAAAAWASTAGASVWRAEGAQFETGVSFSLLSQLIL